MLKGRTIAVVFVASAVSAAWLAPAAQASSVTATSVGFHRGGFPVSNPKAGESLDYDVGFTATNGVGQNDTITLTGPVGTVWPPASGGYQLNVGTTGCSVNVARSNNNQTVTLTEYQTAPCVVNNGVHVEVQIGYSSGVATRTVAGPTSLTVFTTDDTTPVAGNFTIVPNDPAQVSITGGDGQSATAGTAFANPVTAHVQDQYGNAVSGETVTFDSPNTGASGTFADDTVDTNSSGDAAASITANSVAGQWTGVADVAALEGASYQLTNTPEDAHTLDIELAPDTVEANGVATSTATATLHDVYGNLVPGDSISLFSILDPTMAFGTTVDNGDGTYTTSVTPTPATASSDPDVGAIDTTSPDTPTGSDTLHVTGDVTAPSMTIDSGPSGKTHKRKATFEFSSQSEDIEAVECKFDASGWSDCTSPLSYHFKKGKHKFSVRATDHAGNTGEAEVRKFKRI